eukprot:m.175459 g.175459  ORF g.175459 m.175459 type:complete len:370 (+) comp16547_c3_seq2:627-1736(+)
MLLETLAAFRGEGKAFDDLAQQSRVAFAFISLLNGLSQVVFQQNAILGVFIVIASFINSPYQTSAGLLGLLVSTATARLLGFDRNDVLHGIYGYNGYLAGSGIALFQIKLLSSWHFAIVVGIVPLAAVSTVLTKVLAATFTNWSETKRPIGAFTLPFHVVVWIWLLQAYVSAYFPNDASLLQPALQHTSTNASRALISDYDGIRLLEASVVGVGQIFFFSSLTSGILALVGAALVSIPAALLLWGGSLIGLLVGLGIGASTAQLYAGLWGYDAALAFICVFTGMQSISGRVVRVFNAILAAVFAAFLHGALGSAFSVLGIPPLTFPAAATCLLFTLLTPHIQQTVTLTPLQTLVLPQETMMSDVLLNMP